MKIVASLATAAFALTGLAVLPGTAQAETLLNESFSGASTPAGRWTTVSPGGQSIPCLTAATENVAGSLPKCTTGVPDKPGAGAFQLTDNSKANAGGLILNQPVNAKKGLHIEFDQYQYRTSTAAGADGIAFILIDGAITNPNLGAFGGKLGYQGVKGGLLAVGFDQYGNFSKQFDAGDKLAKPAKTGNSVVIRGTEASGYHYLTGTSLDPKTQSLAVDTATGRAAAKRHTTIDISSTGYLNVYMDFGDGLRPIYKNLDLPDITRLPDSVKLGFTASTGDFTNFHELQNFKVDTLDPDLVTVVTQGSEFKAGGTGTFVVDTSNKQLAGPAEGPITTTFDVPPGLTLKSAGGDGWACTQASPVTCTRPTGLQAGEKAPSIKVEVTIPAEKAPASAQLTAISAVKNEHKPSDNIGVSPVVPITALPPTPGPDLSIKTTPDGPFKAGTGGSSTTIVANDPKAGPAAGPTTVTIPAPAGTKVATSSGDGWTCTISADKATSTCTRPDVLLPGKPFPVINTVFTVPETVKGPLTLTGEVAVKGDTDLTNNKASSDPVVVEAAVVEIGDIVCHGGQFNAQFNPGIGFLTGTVRLSANGDLGICSSKKYPRITGGTFRAEASVKAACPGPIGPGYAKVTVYWNDGSKSVIDQSTFRGDASSFSFEGGAVSTGTFSGGTARANGRTTSNLIELGAGCALGGLTSYSASIDTFAVGDI